MAKEYALTVAMPEFDEESAYNHDRPISSLIRTQLLHLHTAENLVLPEKDRTGININHLLTERQASEYIQEVTALLHRHGKAAKRKAAASGKSKGGQKGPKKAGKASRRSKASGSKAPRTRSSAKRGKSRN
jgi:hypothetical protein